MLAGGVAGYMVDDVLEGGDLLAVDELLSWMQFLISNVMVGDLLGESEGHENPDGSVAPAPVDQDCVCGADRVNGELQRVAVHGQNPLEAEYGPGREHRRQRGGL